MCTDLRYLHPPSLSSLSSPYFQCTSLPFSQPGSLWGHVVKWSSDLIHDKSYHIFWRNYFMWINSLIWFMDPHAELEAYLRKHWTVGAGLRSEGGNCLVLLLKIFLPESVIVAFTIGYYFYEWDCVLPDRNICFSILFYFLQIWKAVGFRNVNSISADSSAALFSHEYQLLLKCTLYIVLANIQLLGVKCYGK